VRCRHHGLRAVRRRGLEQRERVGRRPWAVVEAGDGVAVEVDQIAPRPVSTAGKVASRISTSRASDQPATYW
jgi:hypothetical protein